MNNLALSIVTVGRKNPIIKDLFLSDVSRLEVGRISPHDLPLLEKLIAKRNYEIGVHAPLPRPSNHHSLTHGYITDKKRLTLLELAAKSYAKSIQLKANYINYHLPLYSLETTNRLIKKQGIRQLQEIILADCQYLRQLQTPTGPPIYLEIVDLDNQALTPNFLLSILDSLKFGLCLDIGHFQGALHNFPDHSLSSLMKDFFPFVKTVHVYNTQGFVGHKHCLPHPSQNPTDGWIDLPKTIRELRRYSPNCLYVLEYSIKYAKDLKMVKEGVDWIKQLLD